MTVLKEDEFCYIQDPFDPATGLNSVGKKIIKLQP